MMRKKASPPSGEASSSYCLGQVSGSLTQCAASASLSALFGASTAPPTGNLFVPVGGVLSQPAPPAGGVLSKPSAQLAAGRHKKPKVKTEGELRLESRELSLRTADEAERAPARRKRAVREAEGGAEEQRWTPKRRRREGRTAFVGNLPSDCTEKMLLGLFRDDGAVESIRFRSLVREDLDVSQRVAAIKRLERTSTRSINAYVVFREPEGVVKAMRRNGTEIQKDFIIRVDRVSDSAQKTHDHKRSVFVGNLDFELQELALRRHFQECGTVEAVRLVRDQHTGVGKGFGYVLFESPDSVQLALKLDGSDLKGRGVRVQRSTKKKADGRAPEKKAPAVKGHPRQAFKGEMAEPTQKSKKKHAFKGEMAEPTQKRKKKRARKS
ncbi:RNA-binding protein 34 isoform X2 [Stigmatopora argus]